MPILQLPGKACVVSPSILWHPAASLGISWHILASLCISLYFTASHGISLHLSASRCISLHLSASRGSTRHLTASRGISRHLKASRCISWHFLPPKKNVIPTMPAQLPFCALRCSDATTVCVVSFLSASLALVMLHFAIKNLGTKSCAPPNHLIEDPFTLPGLCSQPLAASMAFLHEVGWCSTSQEVFCTSITSNF